MTIEYKQSLKEINTILNFMGHEYINKLPEKLIIFIKENMDNSYICNINANTPINQQEMKQDTKILLSLIYRNYWCDEEQKKKLIEEDKILNDKYEKELREKYNTENLFKNKNKNINITTDKNQVKDVSIIKYKESILKKILNKIKMIFKR